MKNIIIVGAGGLGKEIVWLIEDINIKHPTYVIQGYVDDEKPIGWSYNGYSVIGRINELPELCCMSRANAVIALQKGSDRRRIVEDLGEFDSWETLIHPSAIISMTSSIGKGCMFFANCIVSIDTVIGDFALCYLASIISDNCEIGDFVSMMSGSTVSEHVVIEDETYLSAGVTVCPDIKIGRRATAGAGTLVNKNLASNEVVNGKSGLFFK